MKQSILVTGAAGFIGSHLCEALLEEGYKVTGIDNFDPFYDIEIKKKNLETSLLHNDFRFINGDAGDKKILESISGSVDTVVHLAAKAGVQPSLIDPEGYIHSNISVTNVLLEWMRKKGIKKFVFASSSSVYGNAANIPFNENDTAAEPISPYAFSKRSCELMNYTYHSLYQMDVINLRFFTVYGERQRPDLAIHKFVKLILAGKPISLFGDGTTSRDYTYYGDTLNGIIAAIRYVSQEKGLYEIINLGNNTPVYLSELIEVIGASLKIKPLIQYEGMKQGDVNITYANIDKASNLLGYNPRVDLSSGIANFIQWYKKTYLQTSS